MPIWTISAATAAPKITGLARVGFFVHDRDKAVEFYKGFLGYDVEPASAPAMRVRISDRQSIELIPWSESGADRLAYFSLETDNAEALRNALHKRGVAVPANTVNSGGESGGGENAFKIMDPDGHVIELIQFPKDTHPTRELHGVGISTHLTHVGILVSDLPRSLRFYRDVLGLTELWRGSNNGNTLSWVHLKVPDGGEYIEFMLYAHLPDPDKRGTQHHLCLEVDDVANAAETLKTRPMPPECKEPTAIKTGFNGKRQINYYDPDGTRVELMDAQTADGQPRAPSTAPAPQGDQSPLAELLHSPAAANVPMPATQP